MAQFGRALRSGRRVLWRAHPVGEEAKPTKAPRSKSIASTDALRRFWAPQEGRAGVTKAEKQIKTKYNEVWLSLVERCVRDAEAAGSNPVASTKFLTENEGLSSTFGHFLC